MTEAPDEQPGDLVGLSGQEIATKFSSRFPQFRCAVCGTDEFGLVDKVDEGYVSQHTIYLHGSHLPAHVQSADTISMACQNCGHVYQFLLSILRRRLEKE